MNKNILIIVGVASLAAVAIVGILFANQNMSPQNKDNRPMSVAQKSDSSGTKGGQIDMTSQKEVTIDIKDFAFSKPDIKIKKGTKVTWTNRDSAKHNVILDNTAKGAPRPEDVKPDVLAGPLLAQGESYSFTFNEVTDAAYHCSPHPYMKGKVSVVE